MAVLAGSWMTGCALGDEILDEANPIDPVNVYFAVDSQCDQIKAVKESEGDPGENIVNCLSEEEFISDLKDACAGRPDTGNVQRDPDQFLIGVPGTTRIEGGRCP